MRKAFFYKIIAFVALVGGFIKLPFAYADGEVAISMFVTPMNEKIELKPGDIYEGVVEVSNAANAVYDLNYLVKVGSYNIKSNENSKDDYGTIETNEAERSTRNMMMDWITISEPTGTVEPNGTAKVKYKINVPENAPAGAQYATLLVNDTTKLPGDTQEQSENIAIENKLQIIVSLLANIDGNTVEKGTILDNSMPTFLTSGPLAATSLVQNDGNIYTNASYILQVWPLFSDEEICTNEEKPDTALVLPDTKRYHAQNCDLPSIGIFRARQIVKIFEETSITEKIVIVCPIWLLFLIIFGVIALIIWIVLHVKARRKKFRKTVTTEQ